MTLSYLIHGSLIVGLLCLIGRRQPSNALFYSGAMVKLLAGICLGLIYKFYYESGDTLKYFEAAVVLSEQPITHWFTTKHTAVEAFSGQPRAILFTQITASICLLTGGDYWVVACYFSLVSFLCYWFLFRQINDTLPNIRWPAAVALLYFPSSVFWSSGIMKGTVTNAAIMVLIALTLKTFYQKRLFHADRLLGLLAFLSLLYIKYYLLAILLPILFYVIIDRWANRHGVTQSYRIFFFIILTVSTMAIAPFINPNLRLSKLPEAIHRNQRDVYFLTESRSSIDLRMEPNWSSLLAHIPVSLLAGMYGPTPLDGGSPWSWIPKVENTLLIFFSGWSMWLLFKQRRFEPDILLLSALAYVCIICAILPLAAPNYGALSRYKASMTPLLVMAVTILPAWKIFSGRNNSKFASQDG